MTLGASRRYSCMKPVGRRCVHARPDFSRYSSISLCMRPKMNAVSGCAAAKPENLRTRSTPSRAGPRVSPRDMSPSTISTVGTLSRAAAFARSLTRTRTGSCRRTNSFTMKEPAVPVAPVSSFITVSPWVGVPEPKTFEAPKRSQPAGRTCTFIASSSTACSTPPPRAALSSTPTPGSMASTCYAASCSAVCLRAMRRGRWDNGRMAVAFRWTARCASKPPTAPEASACCDTALGHPSPWTGYVNWGPERLLCEGTKPGPGGNGPLLLTPLKLLNRLAALVPPIEGDVLNEALGVLALGGTPTDFPSPTTPPRLEVHLALVDKGTKSRLVASWHKKRLIPARGSGPVHAGYANSSIAFDDRPNGSYWPERRRLSRSTLSSVGSDVGTERQQKSFFLSYHLS